VAAVVPDATIIAASQQEIPDAVREADVFCGHAKERPVDWDDVVACGRLRWIQSSAAGLDHCLVPAVVQSSVLVTSASGLFADQVAEQTLALLLGLLRGLPTFFRQALRKEFVRRPTADLHGTRIGIAGFGGNGRRLAELLTHFRARIWATDYFPLDRPAYVERLLPPEGLDELLSFSDILILCVPLTEVTRGMINTRTLGRLRRGAVLINVARGPVVVEADLIAALEAGQLSAAGLDVTAEEPLPATSRLWDLPQVLITPHVGAQSRSRYDDATTLFCTNLARYVCGQPLVNLVDKQLGFPRREGRPALP
jgi:D-3-phosphoglycerate dehydrogenase